MSITMIDEDAFVTNTMLDERLELDKYTGRTEATEDDFNGIPKTDLRLTTRSHDVELNTPNTDKTTEVICDSFNKTKPGKMYTESEYIQIKAERDRARKYLWCYMSASFLFLMWILITAT